MMINPKTAVSLHAILNGAIKTDEQLAPYTTFGTGGNAAIMAFPNDEAEVIKCLKFAKERGIPYFIMGKGSNLLVSDSGYDGIVIKIAENFSGIKIDGSKVCAGAGIALSVLCKETVSNGLSGLEFAAGIPGTLGGAITMNAGAYDGEIKDFVHRVRAINQDLTVAEIEVKDMGFSYRTSAVIEKQLVVLSATLRLGPGNKMESEEKIALFANARREKQPLDSRSAGSTFKRPPGNFAGALIESCGLKGYSIGGAEVSKKHAGFIINKGNATSSDIYKLILHVQKAVAKQTGVCLETEVKLLGEFDA